MVLFASPAKGRWGKTRSGCLGGVLEAHLHCADTDAASARPVGAGKTDTYCNKLAPAARIYLHLICRKRHLPLKLRKGKTNGVQTKFCTNIAQSNVWRNVTVSTGVPNRAARDTYIRRCGESPLKKSVPYKRPVAAAES